MLASIVTIGDELLNGQTIDTNSAWLATELNHLGIGIAMRLSVGDKAQDILWALDESQRGADYIFLTGGLGPTSDDITKPTLQSYFGGDMVLHQPTLVHITAFFEKLHRPMIERNKLQAMVPTSCEVIANHFGTAPAMRFLKNNKTFISLPGVPFEMKQIFTHELIPFLEKASKEHIIHQYLLIAGLGESFLAEKIKDIEAQLPAYIKLAYLPHWGFVKLRLTATHNKPKHVLTEEVRTYQQLLALRLQENLITTEYDNIRDALTALLKQRRLTVATAESCTGGYIAHLLSEQVGASSYFLGSVIAYSNQLKQDLLQVSEHILHTYSEVSEETAKAMLEGLFLHTKASVGIAITGYLSKDVARPHIPVGKLCIAAGSADKHLVRVLQLPSTDRVKNIHYASLQALYLLYQFLVQKA